MRRFRVVPRVLASFFMVPVLTVIADFIGIIGGYFVGVKLLGINEGLFINKIVKYVDLEDIYNGLVKPARYGLRD